MTRASCSDCKGTLGPVKQVPHQVKVGNLVYLGTVPARACSRCAMKFYDGPGLVAFDREVAGVLAKNPAAATGEAFRFMRKSLGLKTLALAELLGLQPETISRIETGRLPADMRSVALLGELVLDSLSGRSDTRERLEALAKVGSTRNQRVDTYREKLKRLPRGPERARVEAALRDWLTMGPRRKLGLA